MSVPVVIRNDVHYRAVVLHNNKNKNNDKTFVEHCSAIASEVLVEQVGQLYMYVVLNKWVVRLDLNAERVSQLTTEVGREFQKVSPSKGTSWNGTANDHSDWMPLRALMCQLSA